MEELERAYVVPLGKVYEKPRAKRAKNPVSLPEALVQVISGKQGVSISEAVAGVLATGYTSTSKDFPNIVKKTLANDKRFERVARGVYRVRG